MSTTTIQDLTYTAFVDRFQPVTNHLNANAPFDGWMFETFGEELTFVAAQPANRLWTVTDCDGQMSIESGCHFVNRIGYIVTTEPVEDDRIYAIACEDATADDPAAGSLLVETLERLRLDCEMALDQRWDKGDDGFRAMIDSIDAALASLPEREVQS